MFNCPVKEYLLEEPPGKMQFDKYN